MQFRYMRYLQGKVSSSLVQTYTAMGKDPAEIGATLGRRNASRRNKPCASTGQVEEICQMDCEAMRQGKVTPTCLQLMATLYATCPAAEALGVTRAEAASLAAWMFRTMPEPMRSEMSIGIVNTVMKMPTAVRENWASKLRVERKAASK